MEGICLVICVLQTVFRAFKDVTNPVKTFLLIFMASNFPSHLRPSAPPEPDDFSDEPEPHRPRAEAVDEQNAPLPFPDENGHDNGK